MKKIFAAVLASSMMLVGIQAHAQMAVNAGYVNSTMTTKIGNTKSSGDVNGFRAGVTYNIPVVAGLGVEPGLDFEMLFTSDAKSGYLTGSVTEGYVQIPVMANYGIELMPDCRLFAYAGPTLSVGVISNSKITAGGIDATLKNYENDSYERIDVLVGGGVGFDINNIRVKVGYNAGLLDRDNGKLMELHRSEIALGLGWLF